MPFFLIVAAAVNFVLITLAVAKGAQSESSDGDGGAS